MKLASLTVHPPWEFHPVWETDYPKALRGDGSLKFRDKGDKEEEKIFKDTWKRVKWI